MKDTKKIVFNITIVLCFIFLLNGVFNIISAYDMITTKIWIPNSYNAELLSRGDFKNQITVFTTTSLIITVVMAVIYLINGIFIVLFDNNKKIKNVVPLILSIVTGFFSVVLMTMTIIFKNNAVVRSYLGEYGWSYYEYTFFQLYFTSSFSIAIPSLIGSIIMFFMSWFNKKEQN